MSWAKLDDRFHGNRKIRRAWKRSRASIGLHVMAITYSAQHELDGRIDADCIEDFLPPREAARATQALIDCGLWSRVGDTFVINDYLEFNPSRAEQEARREAKREAGRRGGEASGRSRREALASSAANTRPDPSPPVPTTPLNPPDGGTFPSPPSGGRARDVDAFIADCRIVAARLLPKANPLDALAVVRGAITSGRATDDAGVLEFVTAHRPDLMERVA